MEGCVEMMLKSMSTYTVCQYYDVASMYNQDHLAAACKRWLELNLVPQV